MSPRPRTASDDEILEGVARAVARVGPARLALTDVAWETGLAPATLLQRFGSKRGMLLAALERMGAEGERRIGEMRSLSGSRVGAVVAAAMDLAGADDTPATLANRLAFLHGELDDPEVHRIALERSRRRVAGYRALIDEAIAAGELVVVDAGRLARSLDAAVSGALLQWVVYREGSLAAWVREEAEGVLAPYRRRGAVGDAGGRPPAGPRARHKL
jgi:AcrR family transcriptional regulator